MPTYLLDTSAVRSASAQRLGEKAQVAELLASPFSFWEIASHLEDQKDFNRIKANLMKFRHVKLLQEPTASAEQDLALAQIGVEDSLETPDVIYAMLAALRASKSIDELYKCRIQDSKGTMRQIDGCVARIQDMLAAGERQFKGFIANVRDMLRNREVVLETPSAFHDGILDLTNGWWIQVSPRSDQSDESYRKLIKRGYFFYAYVLYRAANYADRHATNIDANDFEDAKLLLHVTIDDEVTIVTSDKGLKTCLQDTIQTLNGLNDDWYKTSVKVCDTQSFIC
jgi:hypothetical protein